MLKNKRAITAISYGLISALICVVALLALSSVGTGLQHTLGSIEGIFSNQLIGSNQLASPNSALTAEQRSEISNMASEIEAGTASAACLLSMNSNANAATMAAGGASCLGPGYGLNPPTSPVEVQIIDGHPAEVYQNGDVYAVDVNGGPTLVNNQEAGAQFLGDFPSSDMFEMMQYSDGMLFNSVGGVNPLSSLCSSSVVGDAATYNNVSVAHTSGTADVISNNDGTVSCVGSIPEQPFSYNNTGTQSNLLGTGTDW